MATRKCGNILWPSGSSQIFLFFVNIRPYIMGSELELRHCQNLTNLAKFQLREKSSDLPSYW